MIPDNPHILYGGKVTSGAIIVEIKLKNSAISYPCHVYVAGIT